MIAKGRRKETIPQLSDRAKSLRRVVRILIATMLTCAAALLAAAALAAPGDLDTTFNGTGKVTTTINGSSTDEANAVAIQPDGKIVAAGYSAGTSTGFAVVRYNPNGSLDTTFNGTGKVTTQVGSYDDANAVAIQPDGKIVAAGYSFVSTNHDFAVVRYNSDGSLDSTFGGTGKVTTPVGSGTDEANAVAIQPDGKIVAVGFSLGARYNFAVVRYNPNGSLDTSFNSTGVVKTLVGTSNSLAQAVAIQPDGKIVVAGESFNDPYYDFAVARYNPDGSLNTTFGGTGTMSTPVGSSDDFAYAVALQPDGKIVLAGSSNNGFDNDFAVVRYNSNGTLDTSFNSNGKVTIPVGSNSNDVATAVTLQPDGKIVAAGASSSNIAIVCYNSNGMLDTSFNSTGIVTTPVGNISAGAHAVALQPDGKIVVAGSSQGTSTDFAVVRYLDFTVSNRTSNFDSDNLSDIAVWNSTNRNWYSLDSFTSTLRTHLDWGSAALSDIAVPRDYDGDGATDYAVYRPSEGNWYIINSSTNAISIHNWGTATDIPVPGDYDLDGKTDVAVFRPSEGNWYILNSRDNSVSLKNWGASTDKPAPADYDGDGATDIAVFRPSEGNWYIITSHDRFVRIINWGTSTDKLVPADYDGDGRVDVAVYRPSEGNWYIKLWTGSVVLKGWGASTDVPVPADYDGDGKADIAVWRPSEGNWYIIQSATNTVKLANIPQPGVPVASTYLPQ